MSSILTNNGAMVALQTMKSINKNMGQVQSEISTGKSVANAKDNAAVWAISKVMESDVKGFKGISDSLALGGSTVSLARKAAESVTKLLTDVKGKIVAAQEENVDRAKIQTDITALTEQIKTVVGGAQFNGLNLINGSSAEAMQVLSSLNRDSTGNVTASKINVDRQSLAVTSVAAAQFGTTALADSAAAEVFMNSVGSTGTLFDGTAYVPGDLESIAAGAANTITIGQVTAGMSYEIELGGIQVNVVGGGTTTGSRTFQYVAGANDGTAEVAKNLQSQISAFFGAATGAGLGYSAAVGTGATANAITLSNGASTNTTNAAMTLGLRVTADGTAGASPSGTGLGALTTLDVTTRSGATGALASIEGLIQTSINAAAAFGSAQSRIEIQSEFVGDLTDSMRTGIGAMVDANMEEASARLQALQVQQQLATQSLSIANQAPQSILSLFR